MHSAGAATAAPPSGVPHTHTQPATRAGAPIMRACGTTSRVTTAPMPIIAHGPMSIPGPISAPAPIVAPMRTTVLSASGVGVEGVASPG